MCKEELKLDGIFHADIFIRNKQILYDLLKLFRLERAICVSYKLLTYTEVSTSAIKCLRT